MERVIYSPKFGAVEGVSPIVRGATDADNAPQAVANLGLVPQSSLGAAGGFAMLDANGDLQRNQLPSGLSKATRVDGPVAVLPNSRSVFTITNFDMETSYTLEEGPDTKITKGTGGVLYVDVMGSGNTWIKVNGVTYPIAVVETSPAQPTIVAPVNGSEQQPMDLMVTSTVFQMVAGSLYNDTHEATEWQLSIDSTFPETDSTLVNFSYTDLTTWALSGLVDLKIYYLRVRYQGKNYGFSPWSATTQFRTRGVVPLTLTAEMVPSDTQNYDMVGFSIATDANATVCAVGAPYKDKVTGVDTNDGCVYVYRKESVTWVLKQEIRAEVFPAGTYQGTPSSNSFGNSVAMSQDGKVIAIGSPGDNGTVGSAHVYRYNGTQFVREASLSCDDLFADIDAGNIQRDVRFGNSVALSGDGSTLLVGAPWAQHLPEPRTGSFYTYKYQGGTWVKVGRDNFLTEFGFSDLNYFGWAVSISHDGLTAAVTAPYRGWHDGTGLALYLKYYDNKWNYANYAGAQYSGDMGDRVVISGDGSTVLASSLNGDKGAAYAWRMGPDNTWISAAPQLSTTLALYFNAPSGGRWEEVGKGLAISYDGTILLVGRPGANKISSYVFDGVNNYNVGDEIKEPADQPGNWGWTALGYSVAASKNCKIVLAGTPFGLPSQDGYPYVHWNGGFVQIG